MLRLRCGLFMALATSFLWETSAQADISFSRDIRPILSDNCFQCHGPDESQRQGELRLDTRDGLLGNADELGAVEAGDPESSTLIRRVLSDDPDERMPPPDSKLALTVEQISMLQQWVADGAAWQQHWSFVPPARPEVPKVSSPTWVVNEIDAFVLAKLDQAGLRPTEPASKEKLLRRVTLDLTGVPPTLAEIDAFLLDNSPESYERVVDRLLNSPRYGERMAWDWLEAGRYADTNGFQGDPLRTMWPWRDWVIGALNGNMPYDKFTIEQLAGDLLPDATRSQKVATGFNRNHMHNGEGGRIAEETRVENVFDRLETTATVWLGLTMNCSRCHDHKFDPLRQEEYYQFFSFFNDTSEDGSIARSTNVPPTLPVPTPAQEEQRAELTAQIADLSSRLAALEARVGSADALQPEQRETILSKHPDKRSPDELQKLIDHLERETESLPLLKELKSNLEARSKLDGQITRTMVMDSLDAPRETYILERGLYNKRGQRVSPDVPDTLPPMDADAEPNRLTLARWLMSDEHPLTARVTVNRYWQMFFGKGLVSTPEDFGVQGERPSHPELMDWLATEFVRRDWNVKQLHKLIVSSATYRQSARVDQQSSRIDPQNRLLSRAPRDRLPAWMIRDSALAVSGLLVEELGGPPVKPYQPAGIWREASFGKIKYEQDHGENLYRRSLYTFWRRIVGPTMFFDAAKRQTCSVKPTRTNTPLHALTTFNDVTFAEAARVLAEHIIGGSGKPRVRLTRAFRLTTSRQPQPAEVDLLLNRLQDLQNQYSIDLDAARQLISAGEATRNDAIDPAEHAAYSSICLMLLNLDEALTK